MEMAWYASFEDHLKGFQVMGTLENGGIQE